MEAYTRKHVLLTLALNDLGCSIASLWPSFTAKNIALMFYELIWERMKSSERIACMGENSSLGFIKTVNYC